MDIKSLHASDYKYLGSVNNFPHRRAYDKVVTVDYPKQIQACKDLGHKTENECTNRGYHTYVCHECKIFWTMDSGD